MQITAAKAAVDKEWEKLEKISAWNLLKVRSKKEVVDEARTKGAKVHFASLMDICHLKNAELEAKHQKYKCRVVLRGDIVKDNSESYAVFTEQGSSASQLTAAKVMDIISRLPGCAGQAADAVSSTQVQMEDAPKLLKIPKSECPDIWIRLPRHKWPKSLRQTHDRGPTDDLKDLDVNTALWVYLCLSHFQAAVHLGQYYMENLRSTKNQPLKSVKQLFQTTERLIEDKVETTGLSTIDWNHLVCGEKHLCCAIVPFIL